MVKTKIEFKQFHDAYGKAYGEKIDRIAAERAWKRLNDHDRRAAIAGMRFGTSHIQMPLRIWTNGSNFAMYH